MHIVDYIIVVLIVVFSLLIGVYFACRKIHDTTEAYLLANRKMNIAPISASLFVSFVSAISLLGNSSETYYYGVIYYFIAVGWFLGYILISYTMVPLVHPLRLVSVHDVGIYTSMHKLFRSH